jgi:Rap1a immunity proteins
LLDSPTPVDAGRSDLCLGYFEAFVDVSDLLHSTLCIKDARLATLIRVYLAYMEKNPKLLDKPKIFGVAYAMIESYTCSDKPPSVEFRK